MDRYTYTHEMTSYRKDRYLQYYILFIYDVQLLHRCMCIPTYAANNVYFSCLPVSRMNILYTCVYQCQQYIPVYTYVCPIHIPACAYIYIYSAMPGLHMHAYSTQLSQHA